MRNYVLPIVFFLSCYIAPESVLIFSSIVFIGNYLWVAVCLLQWFEVALATFHKILKIVKV